MKFCEIVKNIKMNVHNIFLVWKIEKRFNLIKLLFFGE